MAAQKKATKEKSTSRRASAKTTATGRSSRSATVERTSRSGEHGATVPVPVVMPRVKVMQVPVPTRGISYVGDAGRVAASFLPPPDRLMFYGGLGAAAVFGIIDWPVAAAIGVGTMVARRAFGRRGPAQPSRAPSAQETGQPTSTSRTTSRSGTTGRSRTGGRPATAARTASESGAGSRSGTAGESATGRSKAPESV